MTFGSMLSVWEPLRAEMLLDVLLCEERMQWGTHGRVGAAAVTLVMFLDSVPPEIIYSNSPHRRAGTTKERG